MHISTRWRRKSGAPLHVVNWLRENRMYRNGERDCDSTRRYPLEDESQRDGAQQQLHTTVTLHHDDDNDADDDDDDDDEDDDGDDDGDDDDDDDDDDDGDDDDDDDDGDGDGDDDDGDDDDGTRDEKVPLTKRRIFFTHRRSSQTDDETGRAFLLRASLRGPLVLQLDFTTHEWLVRHAARGHAQGSLAASLAESNHESNGPREESEQPREHCWSYVSVRRGRTDGQTDRRTDGRTDGRKNE
ncbi:hypothetical protein HN011_005068 [Eciton burchellii]|nr:hypothetical protein HN011_005068 [Eciton burchellii]